MILSPLFGCGNAHVPGKKKSFAVHGIMQTAVTVTHCVDLRSLFWLGVEISGKHASPKAS